MYSKEFILDEIRKQAQLNGNNSISLKQFCKASGIKTNQICGKYWAKWNDAVSEAGLLPNRMPVSPSRDFLCLKMAEFINELGRYPSKNELSHRAFVTNSFPHPSTFTNSLGDRFVTAKYVLDYCTHNDVYKSAAEVCNEIYKKGVEEDEAFAKKYKGLKNFVALEKSGKRVYFFTIQMEPYMINQLKLEDTIIIHQMAAENAAAAVVKLINEYKAFQDPRTRKFTFTQKEINEIKKNEYIPGSGKTYDDYDTEDDSSSE